MERKGQRVLALVAGVLGAAAACQADTVQLFGDTAGSTEGLGNFTGELTYTPLTSTSGSLLVSLTNTSSAGNGGFLTGFLFGIGGSDPDAMAMMFFGPENFVGARGSNGGPFGDDFDGGSSTFNGPQEARFTGGGDPSLGLGVGESGMWDFRIVAEDAQDLSAADFAFDGSQFIVRFRGFDDGGSDMVPAGEGTPIPLPSAAALGGIAMIGLASRRRRGA